MEERWRLPRGAGFSGQVRTAGEEGGGPALRQEGVADLAHPHQVRQVTGQPNATKKW